MKTHAILAALILAAPTASFAKHKSIFIAPDHCAPRYYGGYAPHYHSYGWYAPRPFVSLSYISERPIYASERPIYRASRYYEADDSSFESDVQRALKRRGYYSGAVDGDIGPRSRAAIREYQADHGLPITGRVDGSLIRSLGL